MPPNANDRLIVALGAMVVYALRWLLVTNSDVSAKRKFLLIKT